MTQEELERQIEEEENERKQELKEERERYADYSDQES